MTVQRAFCGPDVLPKGVSSPMFNYGVYQNLEHRYQNDGTMWRIGDLKSIEYNSTYLSKVSVEAKSLISALNAFGQMHGESINFGVLKFNIKPSMDYFAPIYAVGVTDNWSVALAVPIVTYKNDVSFTVSNSNLESYRAVYQGKVSTELDRALNLDILSETLKSIDSKGYKPLQSKQQKFVSDVQLVSVFRLAESKWTDIFYLAQIGLPTGPKYDSDDLLALNQFGLTMVENTLAVSFKSPYRLTFTPYVGYQYVLPDQITARVPKDEFDSLPDSSQKETVTRVMGSKWNYKAELEYLINSQWGLETAYKQSQKSGDVYLGDKNLRYDLLSLNSSSREELYSIKMKYSAVQSFLKKNALFPFIVYYEFSDMFHGENVNRRTVHEFNFKMFF